MVLCYRIVLPFSHESQVQVAPVLQVGGSRQTLLLWSSEGLMDPEKQAPHNHLCVVITCVLLSKGCSSGGAWWGTHRAQGVGAGGLQLPCLSEAPLSPNLHVLSSLEALCILFFFVLLWGFIT